MLITDDQWDLIIEKIPLLLGGTNMRNSSPARERFILECILWKLASGVAWIELPEAYLSKLTISKSGEKDTIPFAQRNKVEQASRVFCGTHRVIYRRYRKWRKTGLLVQVLSILAADLKTRGGFELHTALSDGLIQLEFSRKRNWKITLDPEHRKTWQFITALLLISIAARQI